MKYHKIPKTPLEVCTAEQMIAYNIAHHIDDTHGNAYRAQVDKVSAAAAQNFIIDAARAGIESYHRDYKYTPGKYNEDAIYSALLAGLAGYFTGRTHIFTRYAEVGEAFPALYLQKKEAARHD